MPLYAYECETCEAAFELRHSIKEYPEECSACKATDTLRRIPPVPIILKKKENATAKPGAVVKKFIEEAKQDLREEKKENKQKEYKP